MDYQYIGVVMPDEGEGKFMRLIDVNSKDVFEDPIANWEEILELTTGYRYYRQKYSGSRAVPLDVAQTAMKMLNRS